MKTCTNLKGKRQDASAEYQSEGSKEQEAAREPRQADIDKTDKVEKVEKTEKRVNKL